MKKMLMHICCGPDSTYAYEYFKKDYAVTGYFYNPNIDTENEFEKRYEQSLIVSKYFSFPLIKGEYNELIYDRTIEGYENYAEKSKRCMICHELNLNQTALMAKTLNMDCFSTTLTISPHKLAEKINIMGQELSRKHNIEYIDTILRKNNGFKRSITISNELNLYRQNYCGCKFSRRKCG